MPVVVLKGSKKLPLDMVLNACHLMTFAVRVSQLVAVTGDSGKGQAQLRSSLHSLGLASSAKSSADAFLDSLPEQHKSAFKGARDFVDSGATTLNKLQDDLLKAGRSLYDKQIDLAIGFASSPDLDVVPFLESSTELAKEKVEELKAMWRSEKAKLLLVAEDALPELCSLFKDCLKLGGQILEIPVFEKAHVEKRTDIASASGLLGLAQALYKTTKVGESRGDLLKAMLKGLRDDEVELSAKIHAHIDLVVPKK